MSAPLSVVLAGGGSAGHISPALALAERLRMDDPDIRITALGTERGLEVRLIPEAGLRLELIPSVPLPRKVNLDLVRVPRRIASAITAAGRIIAQVDADVVVGFGSYVALPAYFAARRRKVPFIVHEPNMPPGIGNRIGARLTPHVGVAVPEIKLPHARVVGMPLRSAIADLDRHAVQAAARDHFGLAPDRPTLMVTGGSQGARSINSAAAAAAPLFAEAGVQVVHAAGPKNTVAVQQHDNWPTYVVTPYIDRMDLAYAAADFILCRSGMNTVSEVTAVGLPAAFVPLPIGNGEQRRNARPVVDAGGAIMVDDADLTAEWIAAHVLPVLADAERLGKMAAASADRGQRGGAETLAEWVREVARR